MKINKKFLILTTIALATFFIWQNSGQISTATDSEKNDQAKPEPTTRVEKIEIIDGSTYGNLMATASITPQVATAIFNVAEDVYDLTKIRVGRTLDLVYDLKTDELKQLVYQIDTEEELYVTKHDEGTATSSPTWTAQRIPIPYEVKIVTSSGVISTSMYEAALADGIDARAIIALAEVFQWSVDFALDVRVGDTFEFIYETRYRDGEYMMPGRILAGKYINAGTSYYAFLYEDEKGGEAYYDQDGNSVQKIFLKAPVAFKYISSGFTTGQRYVQAFNVSTGHRAIDYAASYGTPIRVVGDGTVVQAGWNGSYGNFVSVRHNGTYTTNYAHMSKIAVSYGQKVAQGQTIGYVGSTGFSTGPHLHYEMVKFGTKINPLLEILPPGAEIDDASRERFESAIKDWAKELDLEK